MRRYFLLIIGGLLLLTTSCYYDYKSVVEVTDIKVYNLDGTQIDGEFWDYYREICNEVIFNSFNKKLLSGKTNLNSAAPRILYYFTEVEANANLLVKIQIKCSSGYTFKAISLREDSNKDDITWYEKENLYKIEEEDEYTNIWIQPKDISADRYLFNIDSFKVDNKKTEQVDNISIKIRGGKTYYYGFYFKIKGVLTQNDIEKMAESFNVKTNLHISLLSTTIDYSGYSKDGFRGGPYLIYNNKYNKNADGTFNDPVTLFTSKCWPYDSTLYITNIYCSEETYFIYDLTINSTKEEISSSLYENGYESYQNDNINEISFYQKGIIITFGEKENGIKYYNISVIFPKE